MTFQTLILRFFSAALLAATVFGCSDESGETPSSTGQDIPPLGATTNNAAPLSLMVRVDLAAIRDKVPPDAKIFVFIRAAGEQMPLGVEAFSVSDLPPIVEFSSQHNHASVSVIARVSSTGKVEKSAGDFEAIATAAFSQPAQVVDLSFAADTSSQLAAQTAAQPEVKIAKDESIEVNIVLAVPESALSQFSEGSKVFVIAKAPGNPVPLAVKAYPVNSVPKHLVLSDKDAMMPSRPLSSAQTIEISARISRSGSVSRAPGDWEGIASMPDPGKPREYNLRIDTKIE